MTSTPFTFIPETEDRGFGGEAADVRSAIDGAFALSRHLEDFVIIRDHRDVVTGVPIARVGVEWLDSPAAAGRDYDAELDPEGLDWDAASEVEPEIRQTICHNCELEVEGEVGGADWRDRGGRSLCPSGERHVPVL